MQKWQKLRVSRFTRNLHPGDHQEGLPEPGPIESSDRYEIYKVKKNNAGEWIGYNGEVNNWLVANLRPFPSGGITTGPSIPAQEEGGEYIIPVHSITNKEEDENAISGAEVKEIVEDAIQPKKPQTSVQRKTRTRKSTKRKGES